MTLFSYEIFDAVARQGSFNKAAQQLHLTPSAISHAIAVMEEELGFALPEEAVPDVPENGEYLWAWFQELSSGRGNNGFGVLPLSWADMAAWARLTGNLPEPWETAILRSMDGAFLAVWHEETGRKLSESRK